MCGIAGFSGSFEQSLLQRMGNSIRHRGPDDSGEFNLNKCGIGLVHRRLSIQDLSVAGHQPMIDSDNRAVVVFNGEIYNFRLLREELSRDGFVFRGHSDTEVLLYLYLRDGIQLLSRLNGVFAFAIYDMRSQELFVARDQLGVKPFYYSQCDKGFIFASEIKALLMENSVSRELDVAAISDYLTYLWSPSPRTILKHVKKLEPGFAAIIRNGEICKTWSYYDLPYGDEPGDMDFAEAIEQTTQHLKNAVESQLVSDVPVGAFLSGGLDSSAVVALAKQAQPDARIQCFTIGYHGGDLPEAGMTPDLPYAKRVAEYLDVDLNIVNVGSEMIMDLEKMIYFLDEPQADPAPLNALYISHLARQNGIKVLLSGAGGDDIFTGYRRHYALMQERYWSWLPKSARQSLKHLAGSGSRHSPSLRRMAKAFAYADLDGDERLISYFNWISPSHARTLFTQDVQHQIQCEQPENILLSSLMRMPAGAPSLNRMLYLESKHFLADHNLNYTDKMAMAAGVEVRVPLLDIDLVQFAARLPISFKQHGKDGKWIFKKAMEPYLPHDVIYRPKTGFGAPLRYWLRNDLKDMVHDVLSETSLLRRGIFDYAQVHQLIEQDKAGKTDAAYTIFALMCIELWCRIFIDQAVPVNHS